jgi:MSHA biogenesis protein MshQ
VRAIDTDNVSSLRVPLSSSIEGLPEIRSGRIKITNALGSELLQLPIAVTAQYLNASSSYVNSTSDSSSSFVVATPTATSSVSFGNFQKNLTTISVKGSPKTVTLSSGVGGFILSAPGAGNIGSVDMSIPGLTGASCYVFPTPLGCYLPSNTARATFGVYKGANEFIYFRENY